jgi:BMFP domain-containing protein YqiC
MAMQTSNRLFDDLARVASGAFNTLSGLREEIETRVRERVERMAADLDLVSREEFDAVRAMAAKARSGQEELEVKVAKLEAELEELRQAKAGAKRSRTDAKKGGDEVEASDS